MDFNELLSSANKASQEAASKLAVISDLVYDAINQAQRELVKQLDVEGFNKNIMDLPERIRIQQEICKGTRDAYETAKGGLVNAEAMLMAVITAETNDNGKPKFTNDTTKRAEFELRKKGDWDYMLAWDTYKPALDEMENAQFRLEQLQNEFKAYQTVGGLLAARLSLMRLEV